MPLTLTVPAAEGNPHLVRHAAAVLTMQAPTIPRDLSFETHVRPDGRICWPNIVSYRLPGGEMRDVPPTPESDPDSIAPPKHAVMQRKDDSKPRSVPYDLVIYDLAAYEELARAGWLYHPAHTGAASTVIDNRRAPGA